jgi:hypothetical protein
MDSAQLHRDLNWLIEHPEGTMMSTYHDAGACWQLIDTALAEIRRLRRALAEAEQSKGRKRVRRAKGQHGKPPPPAKRQRRRKNA